MPASREGDEGADTKQTESESMTLETKTYILIFVGTVLSQLFSNLSQCVITENGCACGCVHVGYTIFSPYPLVVTFHETFGAALIFHYTTYLVEI